MTTSTSQPTRVRAPQLRSAIPTDLPACEHALLRSVAVTPAWRSQGLGRTLVTRVIADAEARGIAALYLLTTTAERYFPRFGFTQITRDEVPADVQSTGEFQGACPASALVMRRPSRG